MEQQALGQFGCKVLKLVTLLGERRAPQSELSADETMQVPERNRRALLSAGFLKYHEEPAVNKGSEKKPAAKASTSQPLLKKGVIVTFEDDGVEFVGEVSKVAHSKGYAYVRVDGQSVRKSLIDLSIV